MRCAVGGREQQPRASELVAAGADFGPLPDCWVAWQLHDEGRPAMRTVLLALAIMVAASLMAPFWVWRLVAT